MPSDIHKIFKEEKEDKPIGKWIICKKLNLESEG